jgi:hypothetical protein
MPLPDSDTHANASFEKFKKLLPQSEDASLIILKLHLLVEEQIRAFVDERVAHPQALEAAKLECHQAICLAEALSTEDIDSKVWEAARKLNSLRNQIAHNLEPKGVVDRIRKITALLGLPSELNRIDRKSEAASTMDNLIFVGSALHAEISLYVKRRPAAILRLVTGEGEA